MVKTVITRLSLALSFVFLLSNSLIASDHIKAAHIASPEHYQLLLENEHVLVLKMVLKPGEADTMHSHHNETVYFEKGGKLTITTANGEAVDVEIPDGHVMWHEAWTHQVTNRGETEVIAIVVEEKP